jgi:NAD(P)-dependent dehydrogenase (short-subunit alcohol dehydrogenase family)
MTATATAVMTGASRGLGWHAAVDILRREPQRHLVVTARSSKDQLAQKLTAESGNPNVSEVHCDLASLASVSAAAAAVRDQVAAGAIPAVDLIVANAGVQVGTATQTSADGLEVTFAVNVLANFALLEGLTPAMTPPGRIVITGSDVHFGDFAHTFGLIPAPEWGDPAVISRPAAPGDPKGRGGQIAYSTSKLGVLYIVHALTRRLPAGIDVFTFNPSLVPGTGLARDYGALGRWAWDAIMPLLRFTPFAMSAERAGGLLADAAVGPRPGATGSYIDRRTVVPSSTESYNQQREEELWDFADRLLKSVGTTD